MSEKCIKIQQLLLLTCCHNIVHIMKSIEIVTHIFRKLVADIDEYVLPFVKKKELDSIVVFYLNHCIGMFWINL